MIFEELNSEQQDTLGSLVPGSNLISANSYVPSRSRQSIGDISFSFSQLKLPTSTNSASNGDDLNDSLKGNTFTTMLSNMAATDSVFIDSTADSANKNKTLSELLDQYYKMVSDLLIRHQSPTTGLFPMFSNSESKICHIRDTVYCAIAIWALRQCYLKVDSDKGRTYHLGQLAVKAMRGVLFCWMKQANRVEKFKANPLPENALHSKFNLVTSDEINDKNYGHLQINCISIYLITLAQLTSSGLQVSW